MAKKTTKSDKTVIDVSHPGKTAPPPNSKAVIVTNRPLIKDPMVVEVKDGNETELTPKIVKHSSSHSVLQPLSAPELKDDKASEAKDAKESKDAKPAEGKTISQLAQEAEARKQAATKSQSTEKDAPTPELKATETKAKEETKPEPAKETKSEAPAEPKDEIKAAEAEAEPSQPKTDKTEPESEIKLPDQTDQETPAEASPQGDKAKAKAEEAQQQANEASIQKLIGSKKYVLPIETLEVRRSKRVVVLGVLLSIILALACVDIALDASLIQIDGVKPLTHFFNT